LTTWTDLEVGGSIFSDLEASPGSATISADNVTYTPSGIGPVAETVQQALRRMAFSGQYSSTANFETARDALTDTAGFHSISLKEDKGITTGRSAELVTSQIFCHNLATAGEPPFEIRSTSSANTGGGAGTHNNAVFFGYNVFRHAGGTGTDDKPALLMGFESGFFDVLGDGRMGSEWYIEYWSPDGTSVTLFRPFYCRVFNADDSDHGATVLIDIGPDGNGQFDVRAGTADSLLNVRETRVVIDPNLLCSSLAELHSVNVYDTLTPDADGDRVALGVLAALPTNSNGSYIGWSNAIASTTSGDLLLIPRSSVAANIRFYSGSTTPVNSWTLNSSGHFLAQTDNSYDVGALGATRPRDVHAARRMIVNTSNDDGFALQVGPKSGSNYVQINGGTTGEAGILFSDGVGANIGKIGYDHNTEFLNFRVGGTDRFRIFGSGINILSQPAWILQNESDTNPTTSDLAADDAVAQYNKADTLVLAAYNNGGVMTYVKLALDGSSTTIVHNTSAP
jgi:hypothetical protein